MCQEDSDNDRDGESFLLKFECKQYILTINTVTEGNCLQADNLIYSGGSCHENTDSYGKIFFLQKVDWDTLKIVPN